MSETRLRCSLIDFFKVRNRIGVDWNKKVIVLTFADYQCQSLSDKIQTIMRCSTFSGAEEWKEHIRSALVSEVNLPKETACAIAMLPTSSDCDECLPTNEDWYQSLWLSILKTIHTIPNPCQSHSCKQSPHDIS